MAATLRCPNPDCGKSYRTKSTKIGSVGRCKACGTQIRIEAADVKPAKETSSDEKRAVETQLSGKSTIPSGRSDPAGLEKLGRFEIRKRLGSGAFGTVYQAYDPKLDRDIALKVPHQEKMSSAKFRKRFLREAKAAARLTHPHIVPVFDAGEDGNHCYIASAFVDGVSLDEAIEKKRLKFRDSANLIKQLAAALAYSHNKKVVHRDVKPANIMIDGQGDPHLMDFGLARLETDSSQLTQDGSTMGTPAYMPPEQAKGDLSAIGPASDQYSLGATLYELLTGQAPFGGPAEVVIFNVISNDPPSPRSLDGDIPRDLETICLKAMAKEQDSRYEDCQSLADDLRRYLDDEPIKTRRTGLILRSLRWCRRRPTVAGLMAAVVLVAAVGGVFVYSHQQAAELSQREKEQVEEKLAAGKAQAEKNARENKTEIQNQKEQLKLSQSMEEQQRDALKKAGEDNSKQKDELQRLKDANKEQRFREFKKYCKTIQLAQRHVISDNHSAEDQLKLYAVDEPGWRTGWEWNFLWRRVGASKSQAVSNAGEGEPTLLNALTQVAFSPNGQWAAGHALGNITVWNVNEGRKILETKVRFTPQASQYGSSFDRTALPLAINSSGNKLAYAVPLGGTVAVVDTKSGKSIQVIQLTANNQVLELVFSPDGKWLAAKGSLGASLWDSETGKPANFQSKVDKAIHKAVPHGILFSSDSASFFAMSSGGTVRWVLNRNRWTVYSKVGSTISRSSSRSRKSSRYSSGYFSPSAVHTDGKQFAFADTNGTVFTFEPFDGRSKMVEVGKCNAACVGLVFSADGSKLAAATATAIYLFTLRRGKPAEKRTILFQLDTPQFAKEGFNSFGSSYSGRMNLPMAFTADGKLFAAHMGGAIEIWDASSLKQIMTLRNTTAETITDATPFSGPKMSRMELLKKMIARQALQGKDARHKVYGRTFANYAATKDFQTSVFVLKSTVRISAIRIPVASVFKNNRPSSSSMRLPFSQSALTFVKCIGGDPGYVVVASGVSLGVMSLKETNGRAATSPWKTVEIGMPDDDAKIEAMTIGGNDKLAVCGMSSGELIVVDIEKMEILHRWAAHSAAVNTLAIDSKASRIASGAKDGTLNIWEIESWKESASVEKLEILVSALTFSPDGTQLAVGMEGGSIEIRNPDSLEPIATLSDHTGDIRALVYTPDGRRIVSGSDDTTLKLWDAEMFESIVEPIVSFTIHKTPVDLILFDESGHRMLTHGASLKGRYPEPEVFIWDGTPVVTEQAVPGGFGTSVPGATAEPINR